MAVAYGCRGRGGRSSSCERDTRPPYIDQGNWWLPQLDPRLMLRQRIHPLFTSTGDVGKQCSPVYFVRESLIAPFVPSSKLCDRRKATNGDRGTMFLQRQNVCAVNVQPALGAHCPVVVLLTSMPLASWCLKEPRTMNQGIAY